MKYVKGTINGLKQQNLRPDLQNRAYQDSNTLGSGVGMEKGEGRESEGLVGEVYLGTKAEVVVWYWNVACRKPYH